MKRKVLWLFVILAMLVWSFPAAMPAQQALAQENEQALSFDRSNDYVQTTNKGIIPTVNFTVEAWIGGDEMGYQDIVTQWKSGTAGRFEFAFDSFNKLLVCVGGSGVAGANTVVGSGWHYVVITYADDGTIIFYLDGAADGGGTYAQGIEQDAPLRLGTYLSGSWLGRTLDEVRISDKVRTPAEIAASWNGGVGERFVVDGNTVALWHMDEGTGGTIGDETANNNDGTIYGPAWVAGFPFPSEAPPEVISQIVFTNPERTVLVNEAAEMTIQTRDAADNPVPVAADTIISLNSTSGMGEFSLSADPWTPIPSLIIWSENSDATFYYKDSAIGNPILTAAENPDVGWTNATQGVTVQGPVQLWRGMSLIGTYLTIQEAINAAEDGDTIIVFPGTYEEQIVIDKQVTVKSAGGADTTIIDAQFGTALAWQPDEDSATFYPAVWIQRDGVEFGDLDQGFTIRNTVPMIFPDEGAEEPSESGVAILPTAPGCTIRGNTIEDSNPMGIFADVDTTIISQNIVSASMMGIFSGGGGGSILYNEVNSAYVGICIETSGGGNNVSNNTVSNSWGYAIYVENDGALITNNDLLDSQGTAIMLRDDTSNATVSENYISSDATDAAGIYGIQVEGGNNNTISDNDISYVLVGGISLNNTSDNNLSGNEIYDIYGYDLWGGNGGDANWTREEVEFDRFSVKMETGENPGGGAMLGIPPAFPFERFEMGGGLGGELGSGELYFWAYLVENTDVLPDYWIELDNGFILKVNTGCEEGLMTNEWLKLSAMGFWTHTNTPDPESKSLSAWIDDFPDANVVYVGVIYSGAANRTMYIDGSKQEGMPMEPPKGIVIARSNRNSVSDSFVLGVDGAGVLIVESQQNMLGENNIIVENGIGIGIENSNENTVKGNLIADNSKEGILITHSYKTQIIGNDIVDNYGDDSGIHLDGESNGNEIHANNIYENTAWDGEDNITSYGVFKEDGNWVNASGNWWGDASGPSGAGPGSGDAVSDFVNFEPWADTELPEETAPTIADNLAMPRMTALLGMFMGNVGPGETSLVVEAWDNEGGVGIAQVTVDLVALLAQILPEEPEIPDEKLEQWNNWLDELERSQLWHQDNDVYQYHLDLQNELIKPLAWYLGEDDTQRIMDKLTLGDFSIPVTVADWCGNEVSGNIDLTIVDIIQPLKKGWNLISTPVTLDDSYTTLGDICDLGGGSINDVLVGAAWYDPWAQEWVPALMEDELKPLTAPCIYVEGNTQIGLIFDRCGTSPPMLGLDYDWNLVSLAIPPYHWDSMPVNEAMVSVEQVYDIRGYTVVVSPEQRVDYKEEYRYQDYGFGEYDWNFEQTPWVYTIGFEPIPKMSIGGGYWVFMQEEGYLAGFSTTPVTTLSKDVPGHDLDPIVPRYNQERVTRTRCEEYHPSEGYTKIYLTYSGDVSPSRVVEFYQQEMAKYGWEPTAWVCSADSASLDFTKAAGNADFSCHIDVVGGESIDILYELWEPGVDLPDVPRFEWGAVAMTAYSQTTDFIGTPIISISYEGELNPNDAYKFYWDCMGKYNWGYIGNECQNEFAWLMLRRNDEENRTYICLIWAENGLIEIEHHQYAASVPPEYINGVISSWRQQIEVKKSGMW